MTPHSPASEPLLVLTGISKHFGGVRAADEVDLVVHAGEVVALVGDNAAGKSTIARVIGGVHQPTAGTIDFHGHRTTIASPRAASEMGIASVFQESSLVDHLSVTSNVFLGQELRNRFGLLDRQAMEQQAKEHLGAINSRIPDLSQPLRGLSAGQRQCVAIARTLVPNPSLVVLDEPTASLSVNQTADVLSYIEDLRDRGLGVILISHNLTDVRAVADRIEVLRHGRNNGTFSAHAGYEEIIAAITGATHVER